MKILIVCSLILATGCATARVVKMNKNGGRIIVYNSHEMGASGAKEKAHKMMEAKCPSGYEITEEGQAPVGSINVYSYSLTDTDLYYDFECVTKN